MVLPLAALRISRLADGHRAHLAWHRTKEFLG
jgi:hypothetical protein